MKSLIGVILVFAGLAALNPAVAKIRYVQIWGENSPTCGAKSSPCKTIQHTISVSSPGDRVLVGPGRYISSSLQPISISGKDRIQLESTHGANVTMIEAAVESSSNPGTLIFVINSERVSIGRRNKGFLMQTRETSGDSIRAIYAASAARLKVEGNNIVTGNGGVQVFDSPNTLIRHNRWTKLDTGFTAAPMIELNSADSSRVEQNDISNAAGSAVRINSSEKVTVKKNFTLRGNSYAVRVTNGSSSIKVQDNANVGGEGLFRAIGVENLVVERNTSVDSAAGEFLGDIELSQPGGSVNKPPKIRNNTIISPLESGIQLNQVEQVAVDGNSVIGAAIAINAISLSQSSIKNNNFYGSVLGCSFSGTLTVPYKSIFFGRSSGPDFIDDNAADTHDAVCATNVGGTFRKTPNRFSATAAYKLQ